jgi:hypothetical protein
MFQEKSGNPDKYVDVDTPITPRLSSSERSHDQGCQMVYFLTKRPNLGKFWRALEWKRFVYFMTICNALLPLGTFYRHMVL